MTVPCDPNWRDQPDELNALCQQGARDLHGPAIANRDIDDIEPSQEYL